MKLSPEQQRAVEREGQDVCVVAGPGSGKTRVLTERFAWLVEQRGVDPGRILAVTFTEKAAIEIKQRLIARFAARPELREAVERAWVSTIHGFCTRLLKENAIAAGLSPDFAVLEQPAAERMQREAVEEALDALFSELPVEMRRLMEAVDLSTTDDGRQDDLASVLLKIYEALRVSGAREIPPVPATEDHFPEAREEARKFRGTALGKWAEKFLALDADTLTPVHFETLAEFHPNLTKFKQAKRLRDEIKPRLESQWLGTWYVGLHELLRAALDRVDIAYRARKRREACVDFSDLEKFAVKLLESNAAVRSETLERFDEVLMDELQDTNPVQWRLIQLVKRRLYAVGDINQSIYGFRHAAPEVFAAYRDGLLNARHQVDELHDNYRSRPQILDAVARALDGEVGIEPRVLNSRHEFTQTPEPIVQRFFATGDDWAVVEPSLVAARIREWKNAGTFTYGDVAILVRTLAAADPFVSVFDGAGIPFLVSGGRGFMEARETRDVMLLLAALVNTRDEIPLLGVLRGPLVGLSDEGLHQMGREGWRRVFEARFGALRQMAGFVPPDHLIAQALDACGYWAGLSERAQANVDKLLAWLRREFRNRPRTLAELLDDLESLRDSKSVADAPPPEAGDVVRIMTVHAAKGLEFPAVFIAGVHKRPDAHTPALLFSRDLGIGVKWRNPATGKGASDSVHELLKAREDAREEAEANRLLYVAMTRAEQRLILTHADRRGKSQWEKRAIAALPDAIVSGEVPAIPAASDAIAAPAETLLDAPVVTAQHDATASVTSIAMFAACPRRYYLARYLGLEPEPDGAGTGAIATGLAVHAALAGETVDSPEARELAERFTASEWGQRAARAQHIEREFDFLFEVGGVILRGQIDLWYEEAGELVIVDYKTDRDAAGADAYALQLRLYALALERYTGHPPDRAVLFYVRPEQAMEVDLRAASLDAARQSVANLLAAQTSGEFPLRPGAQCQKCSFFGGLCPEGRGREKTTGLVFGPPSSLLVPALDGL